MSVKVYPDGRIKFVIPHERSVGSFKKASHIIVSHISNPDFVHLVKLSGHRDSPNSREADREIETEATFAQRAGLPLYVGINDEERIQAFAVPRTPLSSLLFSPKATASAPRKKESAPHSKVTQKVDQLFELASQLLQKMKQIDDRGLVHSDIKPQNILVEKKRSADGSEHLEPSIIDFGGMTVRGELTKTITPGYYLEGQTINTRGSDLFALGKTFKHLLRLVYDNPADPSSCKYNMQGLTPKQKLIAEKHIEQLNKDFTKLIGRMTAVKTNKGTSTYANEDLKYESLIKTFADLKRTFDKNMRALTSR